MLLQPPRALSEVAACSELWFSLPVNIRDALVRKRLGTALLFAHCFDGSVEEAAALAVELGGTADDAVCLVGPWEAAAGSASYECSRVASVPVLDVSVQAAVDARTREG